MFVKRFKIMTMRDNYDVSPTVVSTEGFHHEALRGLYHTEEQAVKELTEAFESAEIHQDLIYAVVPVYVDDTIHSTRCENPIKIN